MNVTRSAKCFGNALLITVVFILTACTEQREPITHLQQLSGKTFAVPTGTMADQLVLSYFPDAKFQYFNNIADAALAVRTGKADAAAYDEPILRNIAAKVSGLRVLPDLITHDNYGFAVSLDNTELKATIDAVLTEMQASGEFDRMLARWLPEQGSPSAMPPIATGNDGVLRFGTAAVTEPFSFVDASQMIVGIDIEIASRVAQRLNRQLEVINMDFGALIPALAANKVDMIGASLTISEERAQRVLFSQPYYTGGIAALVKD